MRGLITICIIVCGALGCQGGDDVSDAGVDVQEDGPCSEYEGVRWCVNGQRHWRLVNADCTEDNGDEYCYVGCDDEGIDCIPYP